MTFIRTIFFPGVFVPNSGTLDPDSNNRLDILRCKMEHSRQAYLNYVHTNKEMNIEIIRDNSTLIKYKIPWNTRVQSTFLSHPEDDTNGINYALNTDTNSAFASNSATTSNTQTGQTGPIGTSKNPLATKFDPWSGFDKLTPDVFTREKIFMCVPGMEVEPNREVRTSTYSTH